MYGAGSNGHAATRLCYSFIFVFVALSVRISLNDCKLLSCLFQGDLHSYVRVRKRLREPEAKRLFRQMCEVVKSCHEQGIVLRDLKLRKFVFADAER